MGASPCTWSRRGHRGSAWCSARRPEAVAGASNKIEAIPAPLDKLPLAGALVTIDAIGCQHAIAAAIVDKSGDYLLAVKANQPTLLDDLKLFFDDVYERDRLDRFETADGDHGRIEVRRHWVCNDIAWLATVHPWRKIASIAMVEATREMDGKATTARRFYIASAPLNARRFAAAVRAHWTIENQLHWVMDVVYWRCFRRHLPIVEAGDEEGSVMPAQEAAVPRIAPRQFSDRAGPRPACVQRDGRLPACGGTAVAARHAKGGSETGPQRRDGQIPKRSTGCRTSPRGGNRMPGFDR